jgi:hypothetical protein
MMGARAGALVLERFHISIDTEWDIFLAEKLEDGAAVESSSATAVSG